MSVTGYSEAQRRIPSSALGLRENFLEEVVRPRRKRPVGRRALGPCLMAAGFWEFQIPPGVQITSPFPPLPCHHFQSSSLEPVGVREVEWASEPAALTCFPAGTGLMG